MLSESGQYQVHFPYGWWPGSSNNTCSELSTNVLWRCSTLNWERWIRKEWHFHQADRHRLQRRSRKLHTSAKAPRSEEVRKNNAHRDGVDHCKNRLRVSPLAWNRNCLGGEIKSRIQKMVPETLLLQNYPVRQKHSVRRRDAHARDPSPDILRLVKNRYGH